jgi:hypothetical protein
VPATVTDKTLEDFAAQTPSKEREVTVYDAEGEVKHYWNGKQYGPIAVITTRKPGKLPKLEQIFKWDLYGESSAGTYIEATALEREKRVPVLRKEKAEVKLLRLIQETKTDLIKFLAWSKYANNVMFQTRADILDNYHHFLGVETKGTEGEQISTIMEKLRKEGGSYFGGLKLARRFIEQLRPGGLADQVLQGVMDMVEKNLVPWPYVAGYLRKPVMKSNNPRELAVALIEQHTHIPRSDLGFYPEGTTVDHLVDQVYRCFVADVKPDVLDALTLE